MQLIIGTSTDVLSRGIYEMTLNDLSINRATLLHQLKQPKYLCVKSNVLFTIFQSDKGAGIRVYRDELLMDELIYEEYPSTYIMTKDNYVVTVNYHESKINVLTYDGQINLIKTVHLSEDCGPHQMIEDGEYFIVPCLLQDELLILNNKFDIIDKIHFDPHTGPRHGLIYGDHLYIVSELSNQLYQFERHQKTWKKKDVINLCETNINTHAASITVDEKKERVCISIRGINMIVVVSISHHKMRKVKTFSCFGEHPRYIIWLASMNQLCVANRFSNDIVFIDVDKQKCLRKIKVNEPTCVKVVEE